MDALIVRPSRAHRIGRDLLTLGLYELWFNRTSYATRGADLVTSRGLLSRHELRIPTSRGSVPVDTGSGRYTPVAPDRSRRSADAILASSHSRRVRRAHRDPHRTLAQTSHAGQH